MRSRAETPPLAILPPFDEGSALAKVQLAENAWNTRDAIRAFLARKWQRELDYRLRKELWAFTGNRISVRFEYECRTADGTWWRSHGNEHWEFEETTGLMRRRDASINDIRISAAQRRLAAE